MAAGPQRHGPTLDHPVALPAQQQLALGTGSRDPTHGACGDSVAPTDLGTSSLTSGLQPGKLISAVLSHPIRGPVLRRPQDTDTSPGHTRALAHFFYYYYRNQRAHIGGPLALGALSAGPGLQTTVPREPCDLGGNSVPRASRRPFPNVELDRGHGSSVGRPQGHWRGPGRGNGEAHLPVDGRSYKKASGSLRLECGEAPVPGPPAASPTPTPRPAPSTRNGRCGHRGQARKGQQTRAPRRLHQPARSAAAVTCPRCQAGERPPPAPGTAALRQRPARVGAERLAGSRAQAAGGRPVKGPCPPSPPWRASDSKECVCVHLTPSRGKSSLSAEFLLGPQPLAAGEGSWGAGAEAGTAAPQPSRQRSLKPQAPSEASPRSGRCAGRGHGQAGESAPAGFRSHPWDLKS